MSTVEGGSRPPHIDHGAYANVNKVLSWFILLRWVACAGVVAALIVVRALYALDLPYLALSLTAGALTALNLAFTVFFYVLRRQEVSHRQATTLLHVQIWCDYILLMLLVYLTGYLENPFVVIFVFHVMLTTFIFSPRVTALYTAGLTLVLVAVALAERFLWIPHYQLFAGPESYIARIPARLIGLVSTIAICAYLIANIKGRIQEKGRSVEVELNRYKSLDRVKSNFILQVTHELRGPLAVVKGYHEMISRGITGEVSDRTSEVIAKATRRTDNLLNIIDEMIDYAFMRTEEQVRYETTDLDLAETINYAIDFFSAIATDREISLVRDCPEGIIFHSSRDLANIILGNLVTNAVKYSPAGSTVTVRGRREDDQVHITVEDHGMGIEAEELENVFEEFHRTRRARVMEKDGTGLGLSIIKKAVESLGGSITVYSEVDKGTAFHVYLPEGPSAVQGDSDGDQGADY